MIIYSNRPVNRISKRARTAERRTTLAAVLLTFSVIATLATAKRIFESNGDRDDLSDAAALAYAAVAEPETTSGPADSDGTEVGDIVITDIIA
jgi:hypothetical protein